MVFKVFVFLFVLHLSSSKKTLLKHIKISSNPTIDSKCLQMVASSFVACPAVDAPVCVKIKYKHDRNNQTIYMSLLNRCELNYVKCYQDIKIEEVSIKNCDHIENTKKQKISSKKRTKRNIGDVTNKTVKNEKSSNLKVKLRKNVPPVSSILKRSNSTNNINEQTNGSDIVSVVTFDYLYGSDSDRIIEPMRKNNGTTSFQNEIKLRRDESYEDNYDGELSPDEGDEKEETSSFEFSSQTDGERPRSSLENSFVGSAERNIASSSDTSASELSENESRGIKKSLQTDNNTKQVFKIKVFANVNDNLHGKTDGSETTSDIEDPPAESSNNEALNEESSNEKDTDGDASEREDPDKDTLIGKDLDEDTPDGEYPDQNTSKEEDPDEDASTRDGSNENALGSEYPDEGTLEEECPDEDTPESECSDKEVLEEDPHEDTPESECSDGEALEEEHPDKDSHKREYSDGEALEEESYDENTPESEYTGEDTFKEERSDVNTPEEKNLNGDTSAQQDPDEDAPAGESADENEHEREGPDKADCPSKCPASNLMICARCNHGVYKTFMSVCHVKKFACENPDEKMELISRYPCILSSPYWSKSARDEVKGKAIDQNDFDRVLRYVECRGEGRLKAGRIKKRKKMDEGIDVFDRKCEMFDNNEKHKLQ